MGYIKVAILSLCLLFSSGCIPDSETVSNIFASYEATGSPEYLDDYYADVKDVPFFAEITVKFDMQTEYEEITMAFPAGLFFVSKNSFTVVEFKKYKRPTFTWKMPKKLVASGKYSLAVYEDEKEAYVLLNNAVLHRFPVVALQGKHVSTVLKNPQKKPVTTTPLTMQTGNDAIKAYNQRIKRRQKQIQKELIKKQD